MQRDFSTRGGQVPWADMGTARYRGRAMSLLPPCAGLPCMVSAELSIGFSAMLDTIHDDLPGRIVDFIEEAIAFAS